MKGAIYIYSVLWVQVHIFLWSADTCPVGCQCILNGRPNILDISSTNRGQPVSEKAAECDGVIFEDLHILSNNLPQDLLSLTLKNNGLTNLMELCCFEALNFLDVSFNNLTSIVTYASFLNLTYLNLQNNNLRILRQAAFTSFPNLKILNLDNNQIHRIHLETFRLFKLKELYLSRNQISYVSERIFRYAPNLEVLSLQGNNLISVHNRNFYFSPNLRSVNLSYNRIVTVDDEAFENLRNLQEVNLAYNNLLGVPSRGLQKLEKLKTVNFDGNPIRLFPRYCFANISSIEKVHLSHSGAFQMVLKNAFYNLTNLSRVFLSGNEHLVYVSPAAFVKTPNLEFLDFQNCNLRLIPRTIFMFRSIKQVNLAGNPIECSCMNVILENKHRKSVLQNADKTTCLTNEKTYRILSKPGGNSCPTKVILPENVDRIVLQVGAKFKLYCVLSSAKNQSLSWALPNGKQLESGEIGRVASFDEYLDFEFILHSDDGKYTCSAESDSYSKSIYLKVAKPEIELYPIEIASYYVILGWNRTLKSNSKNGQFLIDYQEINNNNKAENVSVFTTLLPHSMLWRSYTLTHLKAETNYSFCLIYQYSNMTLYKRCTELRTGGAIIGMARALNYGILALIAVTGSLMCAVCFARCVHKRFHIWQEEKYRSRMAESISGQSFLSSAESLNCGDIAVTYENIHMSTSLCSSLSEGNDTSERSKIGYVRKHKIRTKETDISRDLAL